MSQGFGTKAETLASLHAKGFSVPPLVYFEAGQWGNTSDAILENILDTFEDTVLAVRSSAYSEDSLESSMAGVFHSVLHVPCECTALNHAINDVVKRFQRPDDQILVQRMVHNVQMAGVIMTRALSDGSPYYVFNYDDHSRHTDTVTGGSITPKTVYVYNGVSSEDFDSLRLRDALQLVRSLEAIFEATPLDIEFAIDDNHCVWLLQVRPICSFRHWKPEAIHGVSQQILHVEAFVDAGMRPRPDFYGKRTIYGVMPDWNPAEIIGLVPRPLAFSLYRELITRTIWSNAREHMGYHSVPPTDLMVSIVGHPYIDVRASCNSFLPAGLPEPLAEILVDAWLERLDTHPEFHDKLEFEVVPTVLDFDFSSTMLERYPGLLNAYALTQYTDRLRHITNTALQSDSSLDEALQTVTRLHTIPLEQKTKHHSNPQDVSTAIVLQLPLLLENCRQWGTIPFSIIARHAFMAEALLRSAVRCGALQQERLDAFKRSIETISSHLSHDFAIACHDPTKRTDFLAYYGHLRPGTYDILSSSYAQRGDLFEEMPPVETTTVKNLEEPFLLKTHEQTALTTLLNDTGLCTTPEDLLKYARKAIAGREYAKFVFTRHLSFILELLAVWGESLHFTRAQVAMIPITDITQMLFTPLTKDIQPHFSETIQKQQHLYDLAMSFKLSQLIRSPRDIYIAAMHRTTPNFITSCRVEAPVACLSMESPACDLTGCIVCIESADPGYDWIFTRNIAGLITCFGGSNSHIAIRCAEYGLPAAIGCGTVLFERISTATYCTLDCGSKTITPSSFVRNLQHNAYRI